MVPTDRVLALHRFARISQQPDSEVTAFKARLVGKGYTQRPRVNSEETYSLVAMTKSIQILFSIVAGYNYETWQMT
ncbi:hypothetical protein Sango_1922800 [Sesamum angolense]|uniref:Uncharacterized protein n=1 Tax=Sesamum angolense TaxID=2727404 RepID=A0AAE1WDS1_9LAMI|nr:hypothetical protein Sango_1922800 [Sesamum angolense]